MPCPFANALGEPGKGIHAQRIFGIALNDTLMTIAAAAITAYFYNINFFLSLAAWFVSGEILHWLFGTDTAVLRMLGLTPKCSRTNVLGH